MPLYEWSSEMLRAYSAGYIFVVASDATEARATVRGSMDAYLRDRFGYLYYEGQPLDEDSRAELDGYRAALERDLAEEPFVHTGAAFVQGSE